MSLAESSTNPLVSTDSGCRCCRFSRPSTAASAVRSLAWRSFSSARAGTGTSATTSNRTIGCCVATLDATSVIWTCSDSGQRGVVLLRLSGALQNKPAHEPLAPHFFLLHLRVRILARRFKLYLEK